MSRDPWSLYWQADHPSSCIASHQTSDLEAVNLFWAKFALKLSQSSLPREGAVRVLDLATGNGAVPRALLDSQPDLEIIAVDRALIEPTRHLSDPGALGRVQFMSDVDISKLPFDDAEFHGVSSQFGLEYAPLNTAVREAVRVLLPGGRLAFLMHHRSSEIVAPAALKLDEISFLFGRNGVLHALNAYVQGELPQERLEKAGQRHLNQDSPKSEQITGQIFSGINQVIEQYPGNPEMTRKFVEVMMTRLEAERARLHQMQEAALDVTRLDELVQMLRQENIETVEAVEFRVKEGTPQEALVGWRVTARKPR